MRECYRVKHGVLRNGLRFYTQHDKSSSNEIATIAVKVGSLNDPEDKRGLSHLLEHIICAETKILNSNDTLVFFERRMGGHDDNFGITTSMEITTYGPSCLIKKKHNRELLSLFAEMIKNPVLTRVVTKTEKAAVHQEAFFRGRDIVEEEIHTFLYEILFPSTSALHYPIDGCMSHIKTATIKDLKKHAEKYYTPENIFVVYLGPKYTEVSKIVSQLFSDWKPSRERKLRKRVLKNEKFKPLDKSSCNTRLHKGIKQSHMCIGIPISSSSSDDSTALEVLAKILSARLFRKLRYDNLRWDQGVYRASVWVEQTYLHGLFIFHIATLDKQFVADSRKIFKEECERLAGQLISRQEIETWVGFLHDEYKDSFINTPSSLVDMIIDAVVSGDTDLEKLHAKGEKLLSFQTRAGRNKLRDIALKYLNGHSATVIIEPDPD